VQPICDYRYASHLCEPLDTIDPEIAPIRRTRLRTMEAFL